jgi:hypothetical protein
MSQVISKGSSTVWGLFRTSVCETSAVYHLLLLLLLLLHVTLTHPIPILVMLLSATQADTRHLLLLLLRPCCPLTCNTHPNFPLNNSPASDKLCRPVCLTLGSVTSLNWLNFSLMMLLISRADTNSSSFMVR